MDLRTLVHPRFRGFLLLSAVLVVYANLRVLFSLYIFSASELVLTVASVAMAGLLLIWARRVDRLSFAELGLTIRGAWQQTRVGLYFGIILVLPALAFLAFLPSLMPEVSIGKFGAMTRGDLLFQILFRIPLGTMIIEELAFRGILQANLRRVTSLRWAVIGSSAIFALWHTGVNFHLLETTLASNSDFSAAFFAGCVGSALRELTGHLAAPMATHWIVNSAMLVVVFVNSGRLL